MTGGSAHLTDQESDRGLGPVYEVEDIAWSILGQPSGPGQRQIDYWAVPRSTGNVHFEIKTWTFSNTTGIDDLLTLFRFDHPGAHTETARDREVVVYEWPTTDELEGDERVDVMWLEAPTVAVTVQGWVATSPWTRCWPSSRRCDPRRRRKPRRSLRPESEHRL